MATADKPARPSVWIWIAVTLLWGTVFFATSSWMLGLSSSITGEGAFSPSRSQAETAYALYVPLLLVVALGAMAVKNRIDPEYRGLAKRRSAIVEGRNERYFVSLASSIVTSFLFTVMTAFIHAWAVPLTGATVLLTPKLVLAGAAMNVAAGLGASLLVGTIFLVSRAFGGLKKA